MTHDDDGIAEVVIRHHTGGAGRVLLVCEHASACIPDAYGGLGLRAADRRSHAVWDPGAMAVATTMARTLDAPLLAGGVSRLVYDLNRAPGTADAMPARSETIEVPGNAALDEAERARRLATYYAPFHDAVAGALADMNAPVLVTIHSFAPVWHGVVREVEVGVLHDTDARLADAMLACAPPGRDVRRNAPYGPADGVTHTLRAHALQAGHPNAMIEVRNDLIADASAQEAMAALLADWLLAALAALDAGGQAA